MATDIFPCTRFYTNQDWWGIFDPIVFDEINDVLLNESPKWIIINNLESISNENILLKIMNLSMKMNQVHSTDILTIDLRDIYNSL